MPPILELQQVTKRFGGLTALKEIDLSLEEGEILGIIGPNGAGKTTLFNVISGFQKPSSGRILFKGREITGSSPHKICSLGIVRTFQTPRPLYRLTVLENATLGAMAKAKDLDSARRKALKTLEEVGLSNQIHLSPSSLSLMEKKRLEIARALATEPQLLLLDEATSGLTPRESQEMMNLIGRINQQGKSIIIVEHNLRAVTRVCHKLVVLNLGMKLAEGPPQQVIQQPQVVEAYLGDSRA